MAEHEADYLRECLEQNICPTCKKAIEKKFGSGQVKDGVFCSLDCYGKWHSGQLLRRHESRKMKGDPDE